MTVVSPPRPATKGEITCQLCGMGTHAIKLHLRDFHPAVTEAEYREQYPDAPLFSEAALAKINENRLKRAAAVAPPPSTPPQYPGYVSEYAAFHEIYGISGREGLAKSGSPIMITRFVETPNPEMVPDVDPDYVFNVEEVKDLQLALELNIPAYVWGHKGSGKTEAWEQICARTGRPLVRVQHTANTEEAHIVGQLAAADGATFFDFGPLPLAMKNGWAYMADEYDFAMPSVLAVYQPVLEGKPLYIKEAPPSERLVKPHPNFRFVATGNTNGTGDETGLYQGTQIQNSANYDRFGVVLHKSYMQPEDETRILVARARLMESDARMFVELANKIRESYAAGKLSDTISPRALINAARIGLLRSNFRHGLELAFINKLSQVDREVAGEVAQRYLG